MTFQTTQYRLRARRAFTMMELMVTVGIIIVLISLAIYGLAAAKKNATRAETVARLNAISMALTAYQNDHHVLPPSYAPAAGVGAYNGLTGAQLLSQALLGWMPNADDRGTDATNPFGFRLSTSGMGKVYGPYLTPDSKSFYADSTTPANGNVLIDARGYSILYYKATPAARGRTARTAVSRVFDGTAALDPMNVTNVTDAAFAALTGVFHSLDNPSYWVLEGTSIVPKTFAALKRPDNTAAPDDDQAAFRKVLGNVDGTNTINAGDVIAGRNSYLLVAPGEDGAYFTSDDVISGAK